MVCENMASLDLDFPEPESLDKLPLFGAFRFLFFFQVDIFGSSSTLL